jgi:hypothetical protein
MFQECKLCMLEDLHILNPAYKLSLVQSLRVKEIRGRDSVSRPRKLELHKDLCLTKVFD